MSRAPIRIRARAARDLAERADWLRVEAGQDTAERFLAAAAVTFERLADSPGVGARVEVSVPELAGTQKWRVDGFSDVLIFYMPRASRGISIIRVLHAAQNWMVG